MAVPRTEGKSTCPSSFHGRAKTLGDSSFEGMPRSANSTIRRVSACTGGMIRAQASRRWRIFTGNESGSLVYPDGEARAGCVSRKKRRAKGRWLDVVEGSFLMGDPF